MPNESLEERIRRVRESEQAAYERFCRAYDEWMARHSARRQRSRPPEENVPPDTARDWE